MGVDTRAVIVVGYTYDEIYSVFNEIEDDIDFTDWCEDNELESISPYYDASREDCLFGTVIFTTGDYQFGELNVSQLDIIDAEQELTDKFTEAPSVFLSPYVW
jgi:hypothetical protein